MSASFSARLARLERSNRRLQVFALLAVAAALLPYLSGAEASPTASEEVRAHRFVLVDETGAEVGTWGRGRPLDEELEIGGGYLLETRASAADGAPSAYLMAEPAMAVVSARHPLGRAVASLGARVQMGDSTASVSASQGEYSEFSTAAMNDSDGPGAGKHGPRVTLFGDGGVPLFSTSN